LPLTMCAPGGRGTSSQVLLAIKASNSDCIALVQLGSLSTWWTVRGIREMVIVVAVVA
jgi:hypothetical protein